MSYLCLVQHGAAVRLTNSKPGQQTWRSMNVLLRYFCEPQYLFKVPRTVFRPQPHVDAAMTCFALKPPAERLLPEALEPRFQKVVAGAFMTKRKRLTNSMQGMFAADQVAAAMQRAGLHEQATAMDTGEVRFVDLFRELVQEAPAPPPVPAAEAVQQ